MAVEKMFLLHCGYLTLDRSIVLSAVDMGKKIKVPVCSVLLMHPDGPVLIDAGLNPDGLTDPANAWGPRASLIKPDFSEADTIRSRLQQLKLDITDIKMVIITHLHWDHTGSLRFFTNCPIVVQKVEYRFAFNPDSIVSAQYMRNHFDFSLDYQLVEGDKTILPGISVLKTPGHTPGHQSVVIQLDSGSNYIFSGDVISIMENLTLKIPGGNHWSAQLSLDSISRLELLSSLLQAEIIPTHDFDKWEGLKKSPEFYE